MSPVRTPSGIAAIVTRRAVSASEVCANEDALVLVVLDVQDPGNVGTLARTAEAGGMTGMFVSGASANPFSWKAIRGSMGSILRLPVVGGMTTASVMTCLRSGGIRTVAAVPRGGTDPDARGLVGESGARPRRRRSGAPGRGDGRLRHTGLHSDGLACGILERRRRRCDSRLRGEETAGSLLKQSKCNAEG